MRENDRRRGCDDQHQADEIGQRRLLAEEEHCARDSDGRHGKRAESRGPGRDFGHDLEPQHARERLPEQRVVRKGDERRRAQSLQRWHAFEQEHAGRNTDAADDELPRRKGKRRCIGGKALQEDGAGRPAHGCEEGQEQPDRYLARDDEWPNRAR